jgi:hypothetical protein
VIAVGDASGQEQIQFSKGSTSKSIKVTIPAKTEKLYSLRVKQDQVINFSVSGDINVSSSERFPVISLNLQNGVDGIDEWLDGEGFLSVLAGRSGLFEVSVVNSSDRARTFTMKVSVTNNRADYLGGEDPDQ